MRELDKLHGLKTETKRAFVRAFRAGLSDSFWKSLDQSMKDANIENHVLEDFPVVKTEFPIVRIAVSFGNTNWQNISRYFVIGQVSPYQTAEIQVRVNVDLFALSSIQRDRLQDGYLYMLLFAYTQPKHFAFAHELTKAKNIQIQPILNSIQLGPDSISNSVPWCEGQKVFSSSLSFDANVIYALDRNDILDIVRQIDVDMSVPGDEGAHAR